jgi:hypothetical protein
VATFILVRNEVWTPDRDLEPESHTFDATQLGGGDAGNPVVDHRQSVHCEKHCEMFEGVVHEGFFGADPFVELEKAWLARSGAVGDVVFGSGRQNEFVNDIAEFRRELEEVRLRLVELGGLRVSELVLGCHCFGWVAGDGGAEVCWGLLVSLIRGRRRWLLVIVKTFHEKFSCVTV